MNKQLSISDFIENFNQIVETKKPKLLELLDEFINPGEIIPLSWSTHYNKHIGRPHDNSLFSIVSCFLLQKLLSIPKIELLITFLTFSSELRDYCGLKTVPDPSFFSRFKQDYADDIEFFFHNLVDITEPICQEIGQSLSKELGVNPSQVYIIDTTGIDCFVKENNPKFLNSLVKRLQFLNKDKSKEDIYKLAYSQMPKSAAADSNIKLQYINGHFCYAHKTVVTSNALGILRHMDFCDNFPSNVIPQDNDNSAEIPSDSNPEEIKVRWDGKLLIPSMKNFFNRHPHLNIEYLAADSGFDEPINYEFLFKNHNIFPIIDLNPRGAKNGFGVPGLNEDGIPTCPNDPSLPMKWDGPCKGKNRSFRNKFICPKSKKITGNKYICTCESLCTTSSHGRMFYTYPKDNYRAHTPIPRGTDEWNKVSDFRYIIEQVISRLKLPLQLGSLSQRDRKTTKADFFLAGAAHLVTVLLAYRMKRVDKVRSPRSLVA